MSEWWRYENLEPCKEGQGWELGTTQSHPDDFTDFHLDLGCGKIPKARLGIDRNGSGDILMDLDSGEIFGTKDDKELIDLVNKGDASNGHMKWFADSGILPFPDESIESIVSHHFFEHLSSDGFINLLDDCYRVLKKGGILRIIVPLFPSRSAWESSDHKMWIGKETFIDFTGDENQEHWHESFATPYTKSRFKQTAIDYTPAPKISGLGGPDGKVQFAVDGQIVGYELDTDLIFSKPREIRVTLTK